MCLDVVYVCVMEVGNKLRSKYEDDTILSLYLQYSTSFFFPLCPLLVLLFLLCFPKLRMNPKSIHNYFQKIFRALLCARHCARPEQDEKIAKI